MTQQTKYISFDHGVVVRQHPNGTGKTGCGHDKHMLVGHTSQGGSGGLDYTTFLRAALSAGTWSDVGHIVSATLNYYTDDFNSGTGGFNLFTDADEPLFRLRLLKTAAFAQGNNADGSFDASDYTAPKISATQLIGKPVKTANGLNTLDILGFLKYWAPVRLGGQNKPNYGMALVKYDNKTAHTWSGWSRFAVAPHDGQVPVIELVYELGLTTPEAPSVLSPVGNTTDLTFTGDFNSVRQEAILAFSEVEVYANNETTLLWASARFPASQADKDAATFAVPFGSPTPLVVGTQYKWRGRVTDDQGQVSPWSAKTAFTLTNNPPNAPTITPAGATKDDLNGVLFGVEYTDIDDDPWASYQIELAVAPPDDSNPSLTLWNTGQVPVAAGVTSLTTRYGGQSLAAGTYHWRARTWDSKGSASDWTSTTITLTADFNAAPGSQSAVQFNPQAPWRIRLHAMGTNRGPGTLLAVYEHAKSVGASIMYNSPGEMHFTVPVDDPQVGAYQPKEAHYGIDIWAGDGWRETFAGVLWDVDAIETSLVFTGIDYLGLLDSNQDTRFVASKINLPTPTGSKYVNKTITQIVTDQLTVATAKTNSPVGFIGIGAIANMPEKVTIFSTFENTLGFISGLLDSHRQGTGINTRISVYRESEGVYKFKVVDEDPTLREKPALRLAYGELVQGYRIIVFGRQWFDHLNAIGRTRDGVKVYYKNMDSPGIDNSVFGLIEQTQIFDGVTDENDIIRRMKQAALHFSKLGHSMAVAIRSGLLSPLYGWDLCDAIPVAIKHGAIDTANFGSGFWVVYGVAWETTDDGAQNVTMTLLPRDDTTEPDASLIDSLPADTTEWRLMSGPPPSGEFASVQFAKSTTYTAQPQVTFGSALTPGNIVVLGILMQQGLVIDPVGFDISMPGWNLSPNYGILADTRAMGVWIAWKVVEAGDPATVVAAVSHNGGAYTDFGMMVAGEYSLGGGGAPSQSAISGDTDVPGTTHPIPSTSPTDFLSALLVAFAVHSPDYTVSVSSPWTNEIEFLSAGGPRQAIALLDLPLNAARGSYTGTVTNGGGSDNSLFLIPTIALSGGFS